MTSTYEIANDLGQVAGYAIVIGIPATIAYLKGIRKGKLIQYRKTEALGTAENILFREEREGDREESLKVIRELRGLQYDMLNHYPNRTSKLPWNRDLYDEIGRVKLRLQRKYSLSDIEGDSSSKSVKGGND